MAKDLQSQDSASVGSTSSVGENRRERGLEAMEEDCQVWGITYSSKKYRMSAFEFAQGAELLTWCCCDVEDEKRLHNEGWTKGGWKVIRLVQPRSIVKAWPRSGWPCKRSRLLMANECRRFLWKGVGERRPDLFQQEGKVMRAQCVESSLKTSSASVSKTLKMLLRRRQCGIGLLMGDGGA